MGATGPKEGPLWGQRVLKRVRYKGLELRGTTMTCKMGLLTGCTVHSPIR